MLIIPHNHQSISQSNTVLDILIKRFKWQKLQRSITQSNVYVIYPQINQVSTPHSQFIYHLYQYFLRYLVHKVKMPKIAKGNNSVKIKRTLPKELINKSTT